MQDHKGISNVASADAPLRPLPIPKEGSDSGPDAGGQIVEARIHDYISNLQFCISPTAFFQVRTYNDWIFYLLKSLLVKL